MVDLGIFLVISLALTVKGIKALTPAGMHLTEGKKLGRTTSIVVGVMTILFGIAVGVFGFYFVFFDG